MGPIFIKMTHLLFVYSFRKVMSVFIGSPAYSHIHMHNWMCQYMCCLLCSIIDHIRSFTCGKLYYRTSYLDAKRDVLYVGAMWVLVWRFPVKTNKQTNQQTNQQTNKQTNKGVSWVNCKSSITVVFLQRRPKRLLCVKEEAATTMKTNWVILSWFNLDLILI